MNTHSPTDAPAITKRAFTYLRVSSGSQVNTGYSRDGLSIDEQREQAKDKASQLNATIEREWRDPGKSAFVDLHKRRDFIDMLAELKRCNQHEATRIDYVIIWASDRWARNAVEHFQAHDLVKAVGARLVSITEPMIGDDTPESFYFEGMKAVQNQYDSMRGSRRVKGGVLRKAKEGGSYGSRRLGYVKGVDCLPDGREVTITIPDPERGHLITYAFKLYATAEYSTPQLSDEWWRLGLRSRPWRGHPAQKVGTAMIHRVLRNPYYAGWIVYKRGTADEQIFRGRHEALIDQETFDEVQMLLDEKRVAGERPRRRQHYLRGSLFCKGCGSRLTYGISTGENGRKYAYYFCASRINRTPCTERRANFRPELIEAAIDRFVYCPSGLVELTPMRLKRYKDAIRALAEVSQEALTQVRTVKGELIDKLKAQQVRLIRLHAEEGDDVSPDAFRAERARMTGEIKEAEKSLAETEQRLKLNADDLCMALELAGDVASFYQATDEQTRRGYNQAFFKRIKTKARWDDEEGRSVVDIAEIELNEPYDTLQTDDFDERVLAEVRRIKEGPKAPNTRKRPIGALSGDDLSMYIKLAGSEGRLSKHDPVWGRIRELHARRFGTKE